MAKVFAQIAVSLELDELSISGTQLDLLGLSRAIKKHLENLPMAAGPQMRVIEVSSPTKDWQIGAQLNLNLPFDLEVQLPHSRACGFAKHPHGVGCSSNCPTCGGKDESK